MSEFLVGKQLQINK